jgi:hypothetical protein
VTTRQNRAAISSKLILAAALALAGTAGSIALASGQSGGEAAPIYGITMPGGYRDWRFISVAREEGELNDVRAILGNDAAIAAYRRGELPFPDGTIIARLAWSYVASEENNAVFRPGPVFRRRVAQERGAVHGQELEEVCRGRGWGFAQFDDG